MTFVVTATWTAQPRATNVSRAIAHLVEPTRAERGCVAYRAHRSIDDPRVFFLYEEYVDKNAYEQHGASEHFRRYALEDIPSSNLIDLSTNILNTTVQPFGPDPAHLRRARVRFSIPRRGDGGLRHIGVRRTAYRNRRAPPAATPQVGNTYISAPSLRPTNSRRQRGACGRFPLGGTMPPSG